MYLTEMYKVNDKGIIKIMGNIPEGAELLETMIILNAEEEYTLVRIADDEKIGNSIWLKNGDTQENYKEMKDESIIQ